MLKLLVTPVADLSSQEGQNIEQELAALRSLQHPNHVQVRFCEIIYETGLTS